MQPIAVSLGLHTACSQVRKQGPWGAGCCPAWIASLPLQWHPVSYMEKILWAKCTWQTKNCLQTEGCRSTSGLTSLLSKERVSRLGSHSVSLMTILGIVASSGDKVLKTLIYVNYQRIQVCLKMDIWVLFSLYKCSCLSVPYQGCWLWLLRFKREKFSRYKNSFVSLI